MSNSDIPIVQTEAAKFNWSNITRGGAALYKAIGMSPAVLILPHATPGSPGSLEVPIFHLSNVAAHVQADKYEGARIYLLNLDTGAWEECQC